MSHAFLMLIAVAAAAVGQDLHGDPLPAGALARLGTIRLHVCGNVLAFSPDEKTFAAASDDDIVWLWDVATGLPVRAFERGSSTPRNAALSLEDKAPQAAVFSADGKALLGLASDSLYTWNTASGKLVRKVPLKVVTGDPSRELALSADGKNWAVASRGGILVGDTATGKSVSIVSDGLPPLNYARFSPDGKRLVYFHGGGIEVWDVAARRVIDRTATGQAPFGFLLQVPFFSPDGKTVVLMSSRPTRGPIHLWQSGLGKKPFAIEGDLHAACFTADGTALILSIGNEVKLWDLARRRFVRTLPIPETNSLLVSPGGRYLLTHNGASSVRIWDLARGTELHSPRPGHRSTNWALAFSRDGKTLAAKAGPDCILLWQPTTGRLLHTLEVLDTNRNDFRFSSDGKRLFVMTGEVTNSTSCLEVYDVAGGKKLHSIAWTKRFDASPEGEQLLRVGYGASGGLMVVQSDFAGRGERWRCKLGGDFDSLAFLGDGKRFLVTMTIPGATRYEVRQSDTGKELFHWQREYDGSKESVFPDGRFLASRKSDDDGHDHLDLLDVENGKVCHRIANLTGGSLFGHDLAFSPDGGFLALGDGQLVRVREVATGEEWVVFDGHHGIYHRVESLAFSPDGRTLASGGADASILIWDLFGSEMPGKPAQLSDAELSRYWDALAEEKAVAARSALGPMLRSPQHTVAFLKSRLRSLKQPDSRTIRAWVLDLSAKSFAVRRAATRNLEDVGDLAEKELRRALALKPELETARRLENLLERLHPLRASEETLRLLRSIQLLERIATPDARSLLKTLADGAAGTRLARNAGDALARLERAAR